MQFFHIDLIILSEQSSVFSNTYLNHLKLAIKLHIQKAHVQILMYSLQNLLQRQSEQISDLFYGKGSQSAFLFISYLASFQGFFFFLNHVMNFFVLVDECSGSHAPAGSRAKNRCLGLCWVPQQGLQWWDLEEMWIRLFGPGIREQSLKDFSLFIFWGGRRSLELW